MSIHLKRIVRKKIEQLARPEFRPASYAANISISRNVLDKHMVNVFIATLLREESPFMVARFGRTELHAMLAIEKYLSLTLGDRIEDALLNRVLRPWRSPYIKDLKQLAGFFPLKRDCLIAFLDEMKAAVSDLNLLGSWTEPETRYTLAMPNLPTCSLQHLEPYFSSNPWSKELKDKNVLVIHPFSQDIERQYNAKRLSIFANSDILPEFRLLTLQAVQTISDAVDSRFNTWFDALDWMEDAAMRKPFDVAIIGCGAYGFPLAARLKRNGKKSIHLGGATQILFGIKGRRWDAIDKFSSMYNESWVRPSRENYSFGYGKVEGGCYW